MIGVFVQIFIIVLVSSGGKWRPNCFLSIFLLLSCIFLACGNTCMIAIRLLKIWTSICISIQNFGRRSGVQILSTKHAILTVIGNQMRLKRKRKKQQIMSKRQWNRLLYILNYAYIFLIYLICSIFFEAVYVVMG